jgi:RHS repeat-associated protein
MITRSSDNSIMWRWETDPFGTAVPNQNPSGLGTFVYNLRLPGQYFDAETGLNYNYFRDYDPATGRYMESDPIGLLGLHRINTEVAKRQWMLFTSHVSGGRPLAVAPEVDPYAYSRGDPIGVIDPNGQIGVAGIALGVTAVVAGLVVYSIYSCTRTCDQANVCPYARSNDPMIEGLRNQWVAQCKAHCAESFGELGHGMLW